MCAWILLGMVKVQNGWSVEDQSFFLVFFWFWFSFLFFWVGVMYRGLIVERICVAVGEKYFKCACSECISRVQVQMWVDILCRKDGCITCDVTSVIGSHATTRVASSLHASFV